MNGRRGLRLVVSFVLAPVETFAFFVLFPSLITYVLTLVVFVAVISGFYLYFRGGRNSHQPSVGPGGATPLLKPEGLDFKAKLNRLEVEFSSGRITKLERDSMKKEILRDWRKRVEVGLQGSR